MLRRCHYVFSSHWDREWYQSFQDFRARLVQTLDDIFAGWRSGELAGPFVADGQSVVAEDYLEIRPERRAELAQRVAEGRLVLGPWYVMPDEFLVSGESLVRNLRLGRQVARSFGGRPSNAGFVCDIFGHNSQLPQILAGFGIRMAFLWRGTNPLGVRHFIWRGADGTEMPAYRFGNFAYCDYAGYVRHAFDPDYEFDQAGMRRDLQAFLAQEASHTEVAPVLLFDGGDHQGWDREAYAVLRAEMAAPAGPHEIVHSDLDQYIAEAMADSAGISVRLTGELREPARPVIHRDLLWLAGGVTGSRVWLKQANAECENLLCHWAEPLAAFAHAALGREVPQGFLDVAWRWLLQNHPHDSIGGCSVDQVHEDMRYRFSQARQIAQGQAGAAARALAAAVEGDLADNELRVVVFNPLPRPVREPVELTLQIPAKWPAFHEGFNAEPRPAFRIWAAADPAHPAEVPYQRLAQEPPLSVMRTFAHRFPQAHEVRPVRVALHLELPPLGYTTLLVRSDPADVLTRHPMVPALATSDHTIENAFLAVAVAANGTLVLTDKRSGQVYTGLLTFEDAADVGDGYAHGVAVNDQVFSTAAARCAVAVVHNGPLQATLRVRTELEAPARFRFDLMQRSPELVGLVIDSRVTLRRGSAHVEIETTVHNVVEDHRLRVLFPAGAAAQTYLADTPFDVFERPIALRADNHLYRELEVETKPQQSWSAVHDDRRGLAIVSTGLLESAVCDLPDRALALTLFRATRRAVGRPDEPGGQLQGALHFRYWIVPLTGAPDRCYLFDLAQRLAAGVWNVQLQPRDLALARQGNRRRLPGRASFLSVDAPAVVTSARFIDGGLEVRMFNPTDAAGRVNLAVAEPERFRSAQRVDFESRPLTEPQPLEQGRLLADIAARQIVTWRFA